MSDAHEHEELTIDTEAGLHQFKHYANRLYEELEHTLNTTELHPETAAAAKRRSMVAYEGLRSEIGVSLVRIVQGEVVDSERLQTLYDELTALSDELGELAGAGTKTEPRYKIPSYIAKALRDPYYKEIATSHYSSPIQLQSALEREVLRAEAPSKLDSVLGVRYNSAFFDLLRDLTIEEVIAFDDQSGPEIRAILAEANIDYFIYNSWVKALPGMIELVEPTENITFGELFVLAELEVLTFEAEERR